MGRLGKTLREHNESDYPPIADMPQVNRLNGHLKAVTDHALYGRGLGWCARIRTYGHGIKICCGASS
jgi:hypothetical protein